MRVMDGRDRDLGELVSEIRACTLCAKSLPLGPRPIVQIGRSARVVIIGQAPGAKVHASGVPWDDQSGATLREWLGLSSTDFYDQSKVAMMPMGFCYPGSSGSGDKPPRPECAPTWHDRVLAMLPDDRLMILIGAYAHRRYLNGLSASLTEAVGNWEALLPSQIVLPHPSPRNRHFLTKHPWFEESVLPALRHRISQVLAQPSS
jgi:uracil-DNA glycosylase